MRSKNYIVYLLLVGVVIVLVICLYMALDYINTLELHIANRDALIDQLILCDPM